MILGLDMADFALWMFFSVSYVVGVIMIRGKSNPFEAVLCGLVMYGTYVLILESAQ